MLFNSFRFLIFFPVTLIVYHIIPNKTKDIWLLVCSYYFYMCWNVKYAVLILCSTFITYISGLLIEKYKQRNNSSLKKKFVVFISFASNLAILVYFKYTNFFLNLIQKLYGVFGIELNVPVLDIVLPVGISFYTFQALGYTIDVYRNEIYAEKNFLRYALFVSFFPQLVAGPIERSKNLLKQLAIPSRIEFKNIVEGLYLMLWGYFLKIVLADRIAIFVDTVYSLYNQYDGMYLVIATLLFAVQIYCDFAGYSTIAVGASKILGIELMENFDAPYLSTTVEGFWRRWHISLTSWFKDYLYIPLGGSRKGRIRKYFNKMVVFLASGLWHGADLSFVIWGGLNGLYQIVGEMLMPIRTAVSNKLCMERNTDGFKIIQTVLTFIMVDFTWIFFRARSCKEAMDIIEKMITVKNPWILWDGSLYNCGLDSKNFGLMIFCIGILFCADIVKKKKIVIRDILQQQDSWFQSISVAIIIFLILLFGIWGPEYHEASFIYFQF